jgi:hypothetical protein
MRYRVTVFGRFTKRGWKFTKQHKKASAYGEDKTLVSGCLNPHVNGEHITVDMASMTEGAPTPSFLFA